MKDIDINDYINRRRGHFSFRIVDFIDDLIRERIDVIIAEYGEL